MAYVTNSISYTWISNGDMISIVDEDTEVCLKMGLLTFPWPSIGQGQMNQHDSLMDLGVHTHSSEFPISLIVVGSA